jgi:hypothetical protein
MYANKEHAMPDIETRPVTTPLNGEVLPRLTTSSLDFLVSLRVFGRTIDHGFYQRVRTTPHDEYPGINVIELFDADTVRGDEPPSLEAAMQRRETPQRFLLSIALSGLTVVTSRMGYPKTRQIHVVPGINVPPEQDVNFRDYHNQVEDAPLNVTHLERLASLGGNPSLELPQGKADAVFRHILSYATERLSGSRLGW